CHAVEGEPLFQAQPRPKGRSKVPIPRELRDSLREVWELIQQASHDSDVVLDTDDAIQVGAVCGGRGGQRSRPYGLTDYPAGDTGRGRWYLTLHRTEIEDIADGHLIELSMYCCLSPDCRCKFREASQYCTYCDYVPAPEYTHLAIQQALPRLEAIGIAG